MRIILFLPFWTIAGNSFPGSIRSKLSTFIAKLIFVQTLLLGWVLSRKLVFLLLTCLPVDIRSSLEFDVSDLYSVRLGPKVNLVI